MRNGAGLIIPVHANLRLFLESLPAREVDAVVLLDSQDWNGAEEIPRFGMRSIAPAATTSA